MEIPAGLLKQRELGPDWAAWLDGLPRRCDDLLTEWRLRLDGAAMHGFASVVLPVREADGRASVLKVGFGGGAETEQEHVALQLWGGDGAVSLYRVDPARLIDQALHLGRDFVVDEQTDGRIIHGDLHYENVLAAEREPWLVIDPQPMSGDPHYEVAPLLWNRWDEMVGYLRESIQRRFYTVVEAAGFDDERARAWVIVRMVLNAHWAVEDAERMRRDLHPDEREWITKCISVAKAVQP